MTEYPLFPFETSEAGEPLENKEEVCKRIETLLAKEDAMLQELIAKNPHNESGHFRQFLTAIVLTTALAVGGMKEALGESIPSRENVPQKIEEILSEQSDTETRESKERLKGEVLGLIERYYLYSVDGEKFRHASLEDLSLNSGAGYLDKYSGIESPERGKRLTSTESYGGIGANFQEIDGEIFIIGVNPQGPAEQSGIRAGDKMISIQDETGEWRTNHKNSLNDFLAHIRGKEKSHVTATVEREGVHESFSIERTATRFETVKKKILDNGIGYIRISQFAASSAKDFLTAFEFFQQHGGDKGLILDLRNNSGGLGRIAFEIVLPFLTDPEAIALTEQYKDVEKITRVREIPDTIVALNPKSVPDKVFLKSGIWADVPIEILLNKKSLSASETVADILHTSGKAVIVGETSGGKNVAQQTFYLSNGMVLRLTISKLLYGEQKHDIHKQGISPDISIAWEKKDGQSDAEFIAEHLRNLGDPEKDPQLKTALEVMRAKIKN